MSRSYASQEDISKESLEELSTISSLLGPVKEVSGNNERVFEDLKRLSITLSGTLPDKVDVVVALSGGKDSQAALMIALSKYPLSSIVSLFVDTGFEHDLTYAHVKNITSKYNVPLLTISTISVPDLARRFGYFPSHAARSCTSILKMLVCNHFYSSLSLHNGAFDIYFGMRAQESVFRTKKYGGLISTEKYLPHEVSLRSPKYLSLRGVRLVYPVVDLSTEQVFSLLHGEHNPLYDLGFNRVGCFPCLLLRKSEQIRCFNFDECGKRHENLLKEVAKEAGISWENYLGLPSTSDDVGCSYCTM